MKQHHLILIALFFITLAASCGKKTDDKAMDMAKTDSNASGNGGGPAPNINVTIAPNSLNGNFKGVQVSGSGNSPAKTATFTVSNDSNNYNFLYAANYGKSTTTDSTKKSGPQGTKDWTQGPDSVTVFWYPQYMAVGGFQPTKWTGFDTVTVVSNTAINSIVKCKSASYPSANMTITVMGGGGGPK